MLQIAITGADRPLGALLCRRLGGEYTVTPSGLAPAPATDLSGAHRGYRCADLRHPEGVRQALGEAEVVVHSQPFDPGPVDGPEHEILDLAARGMYTLMTTAQEIGVGRVILISQLALMTDYPEDFVVDAHWLPRPRAEAVSLAPYLAELVGREISRSSQIECVCLRFGALQDQGAAPAGITTHDDAVRAVRAALGGDSSPGRYHWSLQHVVSSGRFVPCRHE